MTDIKYFTYMYSQNFECFLKCFHFLNTKRKKQLTNLKKQQQQCTMTSRLVWVAAKHAGFVSNLKVLCLFATSSVAVATYTDFPVHFQLVCWNPCSLGIPHLLHQQLQFCSEIFWNLTRVFRSGSVCLVCDTWEETKEGENIMENRH